MAQDNFFNFLDENLQIISRCPVCNNKHRPIEAKILEEKEDARLIYIKCRFCQASVLAVILAGNVGIISLGIVTDLDSDEVLKFKARSGVTSDDVLEVHQFLAKNKVFIDVLR